MPKNHVVRTAQRGAKVRWRARTLRRSALVAGAVGLTAGAGVLSASSALASGGLEPGNLVLSPAHGDVSLTPTFGTTDGCPAPYQGAAQVSVFAADGKFLSRISVAVDHPIGPVHGSLDGSIGAILKFAGVKSGGSSQWAVGCYSGVGGTGSVKWVQYTLVNLSADGQSYSISSGSSQAASGSANGQSAFTNLFGQAAAPPNYATASNSSSTGSGTQFEAAAIAGACGLAIAVGGTIWYRRRQASQLQSGDSTTPLA